MVRVGKPKALFRCIPQRQSKQGPTRLGSTDFPVTPLWPCWRMYLEKYVMCIERSSYLTLGMHFWAEQNSQLQLCKIEVLSIVCVCVLQGGGERMEHTSCILVYSSLFIQLCTFSSLQKRVSSVTSWSATKRSQRFCLWPLFPMYDCPTQKVRLNLMNQWGRGSQKTDCI